MMLQSDVRGVLTDRRAQETAHRKSDHHATGVCDNGSTIRSFAGAGESLFDWRHNRLRARVTARSSVPAMRDFFQRRGKFRPQTTEVEGGQPIPEDLWVKCLKCEE